ncbi:MAG: proline--tRNA ligase [Thermodesulfobacteriota bacterium]
MRATQALIPTLKETPADAEVASHQLMLRAGLIRKLTAGIYSYLPLGLAAIRKVEAIVRQEMGRAGAQEVLLPMVQPADLWKVSGRWEKYGRELLRLKDRHDREACLGPTHEEVITDLVSREARSYRSLPLNLYQIQTKFRDEIRPRFGLMRGREFIMKDGYSFDATEEGAVATYWRMHEAYHRIFSRCGLRFRAVEADTGTIGGSFSHEFMVLADTGEDTLAICTACSYAANLEKARSAPGELVGAGEAPAILTRVATPDQRTVAEVCQFLGIPPARLLKTMVYLADGQPVAVLVRGDHEVQPVKLANLLGAVEVTLADDAAVSRHTGAPCGFLGPVGLSLRLVADEAAMAVANAVTGGNEKDCHLTGVNPGRDFAPQAVADLRAVTAADRCPSCQGPLAITRGIEVGHIFMLGTRYSEAMAARFLDQDGQERPFIMGCYGIGIGRTVAAAIEQNHDPNGIIFPAPIAPLQVALLNLAPEQQPAAAACEELYAQLEAAGIEALYDDRNERPGFKFKDADLLGLPFRMAVGKRFLKDGLVEIRSRADGANWECPLPEAAALLATLVRERMGAAAQVPLPCHRQ